MYKSYFLVIIHSSLNLKHDYFRTIYEYDLFSHLKFILQSKH